MFSNKANTTEKEITTGLATIVAAGTEINGNIESKGDIRVDGTLIGNLTTSSKVLVGPSGKIKGDVLSEQADILGKVDGVLKVKDLLYLKGNCQVNGNIYAGQLQVDASASFNGECHMGGSSMANVVEIKKETINAAAANQ